MTHLKIGMAHRSLLNKRSHPNGMLFMKDVLKGKEVVIMNIIPKFLHQLILEQFKMHLLKEILDQIYHGRVVLEVK